MKNTSRLLGSLTLVGVLALTGCGSDAEEDTPAETTSEGRPSAPPERFDGSQFQEISECLEAAGLEDLRPTDLPTDLPSDMPSDMPTGDPEGGVLGGHLEDPDVQEALSACGIGLPDGGPAS